MIREALMEDFPADSPGETPGPEGAPEIAWHLAVCPARAACPNTYRRTQELVGRTAPPEMPPERKAVPRKVILEQLAVEAP